MQSSVSVNFAPSRSLAHRPEKHQPKRGVDDMNARPSAIGLALTESLLGTACSSTRTVPASDTHAAGAHAAQSAAASSVTTPDDRGLPPDAAGAPARLASSPRHSEWAMIRTGDGDSLRVWVVYPQRSVKAPVVLVVHEIFGLSSWIRGVADQLAADGFIAIAPDLLTMKNLTAGPDSVVAPFAQVAIRSHYTRW